MRTCGGGGVPPGCHSGEWGEVEGLQGLTLESDGAEWGSRPGAELDGDESSGVLMPYIT